MCPRTYACVCFVCTNAAPLMHLNVIRNQPMHMPSVRTTYSICTGLFLLKTRFALVCTRPLNAPRLISIMTSHLPVCPAPMILQFLRSVRVKSQVHFQLNLSCNTGTDGNEGEHEFVRTLLVSRNQMTRTEDLLWVLRHILDHERTFSVLTHIIFRFCHNFLFF